MTVKHLKKLLDQYDEDAKVTMCLYWGSGYSEHVIGGMIEASEWEENNTNLWIYDNDDTDGADGHEITSEED